MAVSTDTGCFAYANTTAQTHAVAAALLRTGIDYQTVNKVFFRTKSRNQMQLGGRHPQRLDVLRPRPGGGAVRAPLPDGADRRLGTDAEDLSSWVPRSRGWNAPAPCELRPDVWKMSCGPVPGLMPRRPAGCWAAARTRRRRLRGWRPLG